MHSRGSADPNNQERCVANGILHDGLKRVYAAQLGTGRIAITNELRFADATLAVARQAPVLLCVVASVE